jgi:hypothetical protein
LAHLLQALAIAAITSVTIDAAAFSHRAHLELKLECATCHTTVAASTRAEDNNLPQRDACMRCHTEVAINQPRATAVAHFNHALHLKMGNFGPLLHVATKNACLACHRGIDTSEVTSKANFPQMADCVTCHNQVDIPYSCQKCHDKAMSLMPATHVRGFLDSHSRGRMPVVEKQGCRVCHGEGFHCAGCH